MYSAGDANRLGLQKAIQARKQKNREEGKTVFGNKDEIGVSEFKGCLLICYICLSRTHHSKSTVSYNNPNPYNLI